MTYEYIQLPSTPRPVPVEDINRYANDGWRVVATAYGMTTWIVIMEREKK